METRLSSDTPRAAETGDALGDSGLTHHCDSPQPPDSPTKTTADITMEQSDHMQKHWLRVVRRELDLPDRYQKVAVLMIRWAQHLDADMDCGDEVQELSDLFRNQFGYHCDDVVLLDNKRRPQAQLNRAITAFVDEHDGPHRQNLLIVYYTGHGQVKADELYFTGTGSPVDRVGDDRYQAEAKWQLAEPHLADAEADVLVILDCCFAGKVVKGQGSDTHAFHLLAATGPDELTRKPGPHSYTRALINSLKAGLQKNDHNSFSTINLHQEIDRLRNSTPRAFFYNRVQSCTRPIFLDPLIPAMSGGQKSLPATGHLELRFTFSGYLRDELPPEHIEELAEHIAGAAKKSKGFKILEVGWLNYEKYKRKGWVPIIHASTAVHRMSLKRNSPSGLEGVRKKRSTPEEAVSIE